MVNNKVDSTEAAIFIAFAFILVYLIFILNIFQNVNIFRFAVVVLGIIKAMKMMMPKGWI